MKDYTRITVSQLIEKLDKRHSYAESIKKDWDLFAEYCKKHELDQKVYGRSSQYPSNEGWVKTLSRLMDYLEKNYSEDSNQIIDDELLKKANSCTFKKFKEHIEILELFNHHSSYFDRNRETIVLGFDTNENLFEQERSEWFFHYLSINTENERDGRRYGDIVIVRTSLIFTENNSESGEALLFNAENLENEDYRGHWNRINKSLVYSFNLSNVDNSRQIHLKFERLETGRKIIIGQYLTYDKNHIYSGAFVLKKKEELSYFKLENRYDKNIIDQYIQPLILGENSPIEKRLEVGEELIDYLSRKRRNYMRVSKRIKSPNTMSAFVENQSIFKDRSTIFFDHHKPHVKISFPQTALGFRYNRFDRWNDKINNKIKSLRKVYENDFEIIYRSNPNKNDLEFEESLVSFQRITYFILVVNSIHSVSFSTVELGLALAHCKEIFIIYDPKIVSSRFEALASLSGVVSTAKIDADESFDKIEEEITHFLNYKLKKRKRT